MSVRLILEDLGYQLREDRNFFRARPLYRDSKNPTSLRINKTTGQFSDFSADIYGSFEELVRLTLGLTSLDETRKWLDNKGIQLENQKSKPKVQVRKEYDLQILERLLPSFSFYEKKGISVETLKRFLCGLATHGQLANRLVFPIINHNNPTKIIGFSGRDVTDKKIPKWKHLGPKSEWCYPLFLNRKDIEAADQVVLVESIGDMLSLWESGIYNVLVLFGVKLGKELKKQLITLDPKEVVIATNNDEHEVGQNAAKTIHKTLTSLLGDKVVIHLPTKKDFGLMDKEEILTWQSKLNSQRLESKH